MPLLLRLTNAHAQKSLQTQFDIWCAFHENFHEDFEDDCVGFSLLKRNGWKPYNLWIFDHTDIACKP